MALSVDQVYLLNCLSYMCPKDVVAIEPGENVGDYCQRILDSSSLVDGLSDGEFRPGDEVVEICQRIVNDPEVSAMNVVATQRTDSDAYSFVAVTEGNGEAVVCFQGTVGDKDWVDNTAGGMGLSTEEQEGALNWYNDPSVQKYLQQCDTVTVTGHSKGGNKAKYITLVNEGDSVDRCVSFDGQGFSDDFMYHYRDQISARQHKIVNYSNENDYVNILLNDVGARYYVKADSDVKSYFTHHSLFSLTDAYPFDSHLTKQNEVMASLDKALNSYLRTLPPDEKQYTLKLLGQILAYKFNGDGEQYDYSITDFLSFKNAAVLKDIIKHFISCYGGGRATGAILDWLRETFPFMSGLISAVEWTVKFVTGYNINPPDGSDISFPSVPSSGSSGAGADKISFDSDSMAAIARQLRDLASDLNHCASQLRGTAGGCITTIAQHTIRLGLGALLIRGMSIATNGKTAATLYQMAQSAELIADRCGELAGAVQRASDRFENTENRVMGMLN